MRGSGIRQIVAVVMAAAAIATIVPAAAAQALPEAALQAGFRTASGKRVGAFELKSLSGSTIASSAMASAPALFHVWSTAADPSGEGPALAAALMRAEPGIAVYALSVEPESRIAGFIARSGLDASRAAGDARAAIRALGSPAAPAWIFVAPGGEILAYRLGGLDPATGLSAARALFAGNPPPKESAAAAASSSGATALAVALNAGVVDTSFAQVIEVEVVAELNLARTQPQRYADLLREYRGYIRGRYFERPGEVTIVLDEGVRAVDEAIAFLEKQKPLPPLAMSRGLSLAARDHAKDQGKTGQTGHGGSDRSTMDQRIERYGAWKKTAGENIAYGAQTARDVVIQLLVDDGVPSRGHRGNIFNPGFLVVGVGFGPHPDYRTICVQDFAGGYEER